MQSAAETPEVHIGDVPFGEIVKTAREYIRGIGGFEKFAEWGLVR